MINWQLIKDTVKSQIVTASGLTTQQVLWRDEPEGSIWTTAPAIWLSLRMLGDVGFPNTTYDEDPNNPANDAITTVAQQKRFALQVRCESFTQDIADTQHAGAILSNVETRLKRESSIEGRNRIFAIALYGAAQKIEYVDKSGRDVCAYALDLQCYAADNDVDTSVGSGEWINETIIDGTVDSTQVHLDVKGR